MDAKSHWERVYQGKGPEQVSWFQVEATLSCDLIATLAPNRDAHILDVGAGASTLVDGLLNAGYTRLTVLDLSATALHQSKRRLGAAASVDWRHDDVLTAALDEAAFDVWHDRAVFHFLTNSTDRMRYVQQVRHAVRAGGIVIVATFAEDGPARCSGLDVERYSAEQLHDVFGPDFRLVATRHEDHITPSGASQAFTYCACRYEPQEQLSSATAPATSPAQSRVTHTRSSIGP